MLLSLLLLFVAGSFELSFPGFRSIVRSSVGSELALEIQAFFDYRQLVFLLGLLEIFTFQPTKLN